MVRKWFHKNISHTFWLAFLDSGWCLEPKLITMKEQAIYFVFIKRIGFLQAKL